MFDDANAADVRQLFGAPALQSSERLSFEPRSGETAFSPVEHVVENPCFMVKLDPGTRAERRLDGIWHSPDGLLR
ncbi:hypothetical protein [Cupriavidus malaysiensis]|uniref:hypothetical protein n=1 Tax=Cupriavidus malaysiensis TaxID=367825 RepID=UPI0012FF8786|nr:hypothetical protein [Cupriavidus malaysiensis]